jgi:hypothetical protein
MEAFETSGYTLKEENITTLNQGIIKGTFVLENHQPFPGYYGLLMKEANVPRSVFFITTEKYSWENILRATETINKKYKAKLQGAAAEVQGGKTLYHGIRLKGIPSYDGIKNYQEAFQNLGFEMEKAKKVNEKLPALIKVKKFFHIHEVAKGIYSDDSNDNMNYILADSHLDWEDFRKVTTYVKNNMADKNYDIVCGVFYMNGGVRDMVRILKPDISTDMLLEIQRKYKKEHKKYI